MTTYRPTPEALEALAAVRIAEANQVLVEAVRADRTAGTTAAMTVVRSANPNFYGFVAAAVDAVGRLAVALAESSELDPDEFLAGMLTAADRTTRARETHLAELTGGQDE